MTWESYFASVADLKLTCDVGSVQILKTFNRLTLQTFSKVIGCHVVILHSISKKIQTLFESSVCWNLLRFWRKNGRWTFFSKKLNIWYTVTVWQQSDYVSRLKNWFPKMKTIWSSDLKGSLQNNWATFSKMELFSKACKILLRPPITFIIFLNEPPRSLKWAIFFYKFWGCLVFSKNRYSKNSSQISRWSCTHLPTERDMLYTDH